VVRGMRAAEGVRGAMTDVWLATEGDYSEYRVMAVFSTEGAARQYVAAGHAERVELTELDPEFTALPVGHRLCVVCMMRDGSTFGDDYHRTPDAVRWNGDDAWCGMTMDQAHRGYTVIRPLAKTAAYGTVAGYMRTAIMARDEEHAIKIANDRRTQLIARDLWPADLARSVVVYLHDG